MRTAQVSSGQSSFVFLKLLEFLTSAGLAGIPLTEHIIRKMGHFTEYSVMGVLLIHCITRYEPNSYQKCSLLVILGLSIPFVDETIQLFVEGRSGQISDVWLDVSGIIFGVMLLCGIKWLFKRKGVRRFGEKL